MGGQKKENCFLREYINNHEQIVDTHIKSKVILVRSRVERQNWFLGTGGKAILIIKWQRTWLIAF